ncbi:MAG: hypothetical protein HY832_02250 [Candidatus Aenigmarchaeota archaeon]|nr:hypothetical protein [Candidatus Aenigmarchaeota archaeon]
MIIMALVMEQMILGLLEKSKVSLTIEEVAEQAQINRITAAKYLAVLEARGLLHHRAVGKAKLYSPLAKKWKGIL